MLMVDGNGLPLSAFTTSASHAEVNTLETLVEFHVTEKTSKRMLYDKATDADWAREAMQRHGIELQDGRSLRQCARRHKVEWTISRLLNMFRLTVR